MGATEVTTASAPHESLHPHGRPEGAAAARTEELYAQYARTVSGLCGALLRDRTEAEDAAQQVFLSAHRALLNGTEPREPAAWLATIARNECWTRIRTRMREPLPTEELEAVSAVHDPLAEAIRHADLAALWSAIEALPHQQRDALLLREFGGLSYNELAEALAISGPAVESLLFRARQRLRAQLRTAYASLGGASWLEAVARLFGGAPVAAKVAAIGVGAATVTGSAVVVPKVLEQHSRVVPPAQVHVTPSHVAAVRSEAATPTRVFAAVRQPAQVRRQTVVHHVQRRTHETADVERHDRVGGEHGTRSHGHETRRKTSPAETAHRGVDSRPGSGDREAGDGHHGSDAASSGGGGDDGGGDGGGHGGDGQAPSER